MLVRRRLRLFRLLGRGRALGRLGTADAAGLRVDLRVEEGTRGLRGGQVEGVAEHRRQGGHGLDEPGLGRGV